MQKNKKRIPPPKENEDYSWSDNIVLCFDLCLDVVMFFVFCFCQLKMSFYRRWFLLLFSPTCGKWTNQWDSLSLSLPLSHSLRHVYCSLFFSAAQYLFFIYLAWDIVQFGWWLSSPRCNILWKVTCYCITNYAKGLTFPRVSICHYVFSKQNTVNLLTYIYFSVF